MRTLLLILLAILVAAAFIVWRRSAGEPRHDSDAKLFVAAASESAARAAAVLPVKGTEDVRKLLSVPATAPEKVALRRDFLPNAKADWSVTVGFRGRPVLEKSKLLAVLGRDFLLTVGQPEIYAKAAEDGHWTYIRAGGTPDRYTDLTFGWPLWSAFDEDWRPPTASELERYLQTVLEALKRFGEPLPVPSSSPEAAERTALELASLHEQADHDVVVVLRAPSGALFDGRELWDVMLSLGLEWGDMDIFHWVNHSDVGGDSYFSVWTTTAPGYFFPEEVAAGNVHVVDLVFGYSIPRSPAPEAVFQSLMKAANYAQRRLGGTLVGPDGSPLNSEAVEKEIAAIRAILSSSGLEPGREATLRLF